MRKKEKKMSSTLSYIFIITLGGFLAGLLFYSFYLVLTSKDEKYRTKKS
jgi:uncharacterized membrane protein SpoIIM required for sporulation